jgi:proton glutamate symport protein
MGTIGQFGIAEWPIYLILAVDVLMDMVRTGTNMLGNCLATVVIAKWEGETIDEA